MNDNWIEIGSSPYDEPCAQVGEDDYLAKSLRECAAYKAQLERMFPAGIFIIKRFPHDFGSYREVVALLGRGDESDRAAFSAERDGPAKWDDIAREALSASTD